MIQLMILMSMKMRCVCGGGGGGGSGWWGHQLLLIANACPWQIPFVLFPIFPYFWEINRIIRHLSLLLPISKLWNTQPWSHFLHPNLNHSKSYLTTTIQYQIHNIKTIALCYKTIQNQTAKTMPNLTSIKGFPTRHKSTYKWCSLTCRKFYIKGIFNFIAQFNKTRVLRLNSDTIVKYGGN